MALRAVDLHPLAAKEIRVAYRQSARSSAAVASRFRLALGRVVQRIETAAEQGSPFRQRYRWMRLRRFP